jgi:hypothetical protein
LCLPGDEFAAHLPGTLKNDMQGTRGRLHFHKLFNLASLGLKDSGVHTDRIIREFLRIGDAVAVRWIQMPRGILILQMAPGRPDTGAMYLYDRHAQTFYILGFDGADDNLTVEQFDALYAEYGLLRYIADPGLVRVAAECDAPMLQSVQRCRTRLGRLSTMDLGRLIAGQGLFRCAGDRLTQFNLHCAGSA